MKIREILEKGRSQASIRKITGWVDNHPERLAILVNVFIEGPHGISQRASWPLSLCLEQHPDMIEPHLETLLTAMQQPQTHVAVKRNVVRLLQFAAIPEKWQGEVAQLCFAYLDNPEEAIAVRVFAMTVLFNIAEQWDELKPELRQTIERHLPYASAGFLSRARKILARI